MAGRQASPASAAYGAAKAGLLMLTKQASLESILCNEPAAPSMSRR
jgi:NAD(P)-dependent dehydrogenase (short-subunit alcohol dehydrogenase family)